jgi:hypothetical protein
MSALSYFYPRFPPMRVVWEGSAPTWMVFTGTSPVSDGRTLGALAGALAREDEGLAPSAPAGGARPTASACSFSTATTAAVRSPCTMRTPVGCRCFTGCPPRGIPEVVSLGEEIPRSGI